MPPSSSRPPPAGASVSGSQAQQGGCFHRKLTTPTHHRGRAGAQGAPLLGWRVLSRTPGLSGFHITKSAAWRAPPAHQASRLSDATVTDRPCPRVDSPCPALPRVHQLQQLQAASGLPGWLSLLQDHEHRAAALPVDQELQEAGPAPRPLCTTLSWILCAPPLSWIQG
ncbi:lymphocyte antigen 6D isoform X1 [Trachypithecus francoisi]|uniref:lymphocyte antigen 6D isoform X1 n=1 Tax=Trachypithecus francoisi TaxID=54180 RepID=UPI00141B738D|nr:lymphocyte antigen 6D isoform X1 [Trachypithecus francoisi]